MKPLIYMAVGAMIPIAAYEFMKSKTYKEMMKKLKDFIDCKCKQNCENNQNQQTTN